MKKILIGLLAVMTLTFVSCHKDKEEESPTAERTVLIYMAGQNNLTYWSGSSFRYAEEDLKEIRNGVANMGDNHLLVYVSLAKDPDPKHDDHLPYLLHFRKGELRDSIPLDSTMIPSDPATFKTIVQKAFTNYPAKDYGLVLWGHGTGWLFRSDSLDSNQSRRRAYGGSNPNRSNQGAGDVWLNIPTMAKILKSQQHMKFIFADCCNMMCAEVGYELRNTTKYLIGSPAEIPGRGAPYHLLVPYFYKNGAELYRGIIDNYYDYYLEDYENDYQLDGYSVPLSVMDTQNQNMEELARATYDVLGTFFPEKPQMLDFKGLVFYWYPDVSVMYDMKAFIKQNASPEAYAKWETAFKRAVPYYRMSMEWMTIYAELEYAFNYFNQDESMNGCVSMFIPKENAYYNYYGIWRYNYTAKNLSWNRELGWERFGW